MKGRVYDPLAGRFLTADPVMQAPFWSQGLNRYSYVFNNPINNTDPSGFSAADTAQMGTFIGWAGGLTAASAGLGGFGLASAALNPLTSALMPSIGDARAGSTQSGVAPSGAPKGGMGMGRDAPAGGSGQNKGGVGPDQRLAFDPVTFCEASPRLCMVGEEIASDVGRVIRTANGVAIVAGILLNPSPLSD